jgi:CPA2 family monovalent cation:H+ antiporter-2
MDTDPLVSMVVAGIVAAFLLGFIAHKLRLSPIVGYLLAGVAMGPHTPGFQADIDLARELADLGVILILFGVGLKFSPRKLMEYRWLAVPGALGQMALVTMLTLAVASLLGMGLGEALILGLSLSIASPLVLLRALENRQETDTPGGHLAVSWLIVQGIAAILVLVMMSAIAQLDAAGTASASVVARAMGIKAVELAIFVLIMLVIGRRLLPAALVLIAKARSRELFSLGVFAVGLGIAYAAQAIFGASFALGAFVAGMVLNEADLSHRAAEDLLPLRDAFSVLFFVSVGLLFDPQILLTQRWTVIALMMIIIAGNGLAAYLITTLMRVPLEQRILLAGGIAQIGEFSFLICATGFAFGIVSESTHSLVAAVALLTIAINPLLRWASRLVVNRSEEIASPNLSRTA